MEPRPHLKARKPARRASGQASPAGSWDKTDAPFHTRHHTAVQAARKADLINVPSGPQAPIHPPTAAASSERGRKPASSMCRQNPTHQFTCSPPRRPSSGAESQPYRCAVRTSCTNSSACRLCVPRAGPKADLIDVLPEPHAPVHPLAATASPERPTSSMCCQNPYTFESHAAGITCVVRVELPGAAKGPCASSALHGSAPRQNGRDDSPVRGRATERQYRDDQHRARPAVQQESQ
jgi:hypothetical protein